MNNYIKTSCLALMLCSFAPLVSGQSDSVSYKHAIEFSVIPSYSHLSYKSALDKSKGALGLGISLGYRYSLTENWGLSTGLTFQPYKGVYENNSFTVVSPSFTEPNGSSYTLTQTLDNKEKQKASYLLIPVKVDYRMPLTEKISLRAALGAAYGIAMGEKFDMHSGTVTRTAYFPAHDLTVDDLPMHAIGRFKDYINMPSEDQFKSTVMGLAEVGADYALTDQWLVKAAIVGTMGGNVKNSDYPTVQQYAYPGVTAINHTGDVKPKSVGLALGVVYRFGAKSQKAPDQEPAAIPLVPQEDEQPVEEHAVVEEPVAEETVAEPAAENSLLDEFIVEVKNFNDSEMIQFNFNDTEVRDEETKAKLDRLVKYMIDCDVTTLVVGHTCDMGTEEYNQFIGMERAKKVKALFIKQGVPENKIMVESKGETQPKYPNDTRENRAKNRRVEIIVVSE